MKEIDKEAMLPTTAIDDASHCEAKHDARENSVTGETVALVAEVAEAAPGSVDAAQVDAALLDLDRRIRDLEAAMGDLRSVKDSAPLSAAAAPIAAGRKTQESCAPRLMSKAEAPATGAVNDALRSLSPEQRLAVKAGLLRAGLL